MNNNLKIILNTFYNLKIILLDNFKNKFINFIKKIIPFLIEWEKRITPGEVPIMCVFIPLPTLLTITIWFSYGNFDKKRYMVPFCRKNIMLS